MPSDEEDQSDRDDIGRSLERSPEASGQTFRISALFVLRIHARDIEAFRELIKHMSTPLVRYGYSILGDMDDAEDIVQEVFTAVWELEDRWQPKGDAVAYLFASVRNHALDELRRRSRATLRAQKAFLQQALMSQGEYASNTAIIDQVIDVEEAARRVQRVTAVLATLSERQRTAYELRYRQGLSVAAIAGILGSTVKATESLILRVTRTVLDRLRTGENDP